MGEAKIRRDREEAEKRLREATVAREAPPRFAGAPPRARYLTPGILALDPKAFGMEFEIMGGVAPKPYEEVGAVAVIDITGPLEQHPSWFCLDYETIRAQAEAAFACSTARAVALCINSPGGAAAGCFELARALRAMSESSGKPLGVFIDGMACSAAYGIACSATPGLLHAPPTSSVGSLAVYEMLVDQSQADAQMGLRFLFVPSSGADLKLAGNSHMPPTEAHVAHTQAQVDLLTDYFYGLVEEMRGIPQAEIRALRGASLLATQGVDRGLVDAISDRDGFFATLEAAASNGVTMTVQAKKADDKEPEKKDGWEEALSALMAASEGDDEEKSAKAKRMLKALMSDEEPEKKDEPAKDAKAAEEPKKEPDGDEAKKAQAAKDEEARAAQARATAAGGSSNEVALANRVLALEAERASEKEATVRAELLAKRPDFSAEVRTAYAKLPIDALRVVVETAPRVTAAPGASASAEVPGATPGASDGARPGIDAAQKQLLDRWGSKQETTQARVEGSSLVLENMTPAAAAKRLAELQANGSIPRDLKRSDPTTFKASDVRK